MYIVYRYSFTGSRFHKFIESMPGIQRNPSKYLIAQIDSQTKSKVSTYLIDLDPLESLGKGLS